MTKSGAEKKRVRRSSGAIQNGSNRDLNSDTPPWDNMTMDFDERYFHGKPQNSFHKAVNIPNVVVFPRYMHDELIHCKVYREVFEPLADFCARRVV